MHNRDGLGSSLALSGLVPCPYVQIAVDELGLDSGIFGPYGQISYELQGDLSELPDIHTLYIGIFGPYGQIYDGKQGYSSELPYIHTLDIGTSYHHELRAHEA